MISYNIRSALYVSFFLLATNTIYAKPITIKNWAVHNKIKEIRAIYKEIKLGESSGKLNKIEYKRNKKCVRNKECLYHKFVTKDSDGNIRSCGYEFRYHNGLERSRRELYFDQNGKLRFRLVFKPRKKSRTHLETWKYFDENGVVIWHIIKSDKGDILEYGEDVYKLEFVDSSKNCRYPRWPK